MAYTVENIFKISCSLIDSMTNDGDIDSSTTADYRGRALTLTDVALKQLISISDYYTIYEIARSKLANMLGDGGYFDVGTYKANEDYSIECINDSYGGVKGYSFESDGTSGTVYIEDYTTSWNTLDTITLTNTDKSFQTYTGSVAPTSGATKSRIRFSGSYFYRYANVALYNYEYATIPTYRAWIPIQLPIDCRRIHKVTTEHENEIYTNNTVYKIEWNGTRETLLVKYDYEGTLKVHYKPSPASPTAFSDTLNVDDNSAIAIANYLAMNFVSTEQNTELRLHFKNEYDEMRRDIRRKQPSVEQPIVNVYGGI